MSRAAHMIRPLSLAIAIAHLFVALVPCVGASVGGASSGGGHHAMDRAAAEPAAESEYELRAQCMCGCGAHGAGAPAGYARLGVALPPSEMQPMLEAPQCAARPLAPTPRAAPAFVPEHVPIPV